VRPEDVDEFGWVVRFGERDEGHARHVVRLKHFGPAVDLLQVGFGKAFNKALFREAFGRETLECPGDGFRLGLHFGRDPGGRL
jgi:hypothetical protein